MMRIAILSIVHESNSFTATSHFKDLTSACFCTGSQVLERFKGTGTELSAFINILEKQPDIELVPLLVIRPRASGGPVADDTVDQIAEILEGELKRAGKLDGILAAMHGAMVGISDEDPDGRFLEIMRKHVGNAPIFVTMDLHANITKKKTENATGIIGYRHYPHDDAYETAQRAAHLMLKTLRKEITPVMATAKVPMLLSINNSEYFGGPLGTIIEKELQLEQESGVLSTSAFLTQPWLDIPSPGCAFVAITDGAPDKAEAASSQLAQLGWELRKEFYVRALKPKDAIKEAIEASDKTVILVDTADAPGAGAAGDSTEVLEALMASNTDARSVLSIVDPEAAKFAAAAGIGAHVELEVGNRINPNHRTPVKVSGTVKHICDGQFLHRGLAAGLIGNMGLSVVLEIGSISLLIASRATYEWDDAQFRCAGLSIEEAKIAVVKNPINYKLSLTHISKNFIVLDTAGPANPNLVSYPFAHIARPLYPFDDMDSMDVAVFCNKHLSCV